MGNGNYSTADVTQKNRNNISDFTTHQIDSVLRSNQTTENTNNNISLNLNHHFNDTLGNDLSTDIDFGFFDSDRNNYIPNEYILPDVETPLSSTYFRSIMPTTITDLFS